MNTAFYWSRGIFMGNKYSPTNIINKITNAVNSPTKEIQRFYTNINNAVNSLNLIVKPYINKAIVNAANIARVYSEELKENQYYRQSIYNMWNNLEEELKTKNRFFPKNELLNIFENLTKEAKCYIKKGTILYRARKLSEREFPNEVNKLFSYIIEKNNDQWNKEKIINENEILKCIKDIPSDEWEEDYINMNNLENKLFWGYDKKESDAPSSKDISIPHGRANPSGISYLYTALDKNTAISEVQPTIEQFISIAQISTLKRLNVFNFNYPATFKNSKFLSKHIGEIEEELNLPSFWQLRILFNTLSELFAKPILGNTDYYFTTQYISEFLKNKGFDGIKYKSSLKKGGANLVLFDTAKDENNNPINYQILNSSLYKVENVKITSAKILPKRETQNVPVTDFS
jgi:hypothetical protein